MVIPEAKKADPTLWNRFLSYFRRKPDAIGSVDITDHNLMQVQCLQIYLKKYREVLLDLSLSSSMNVDKIVSSILEIHCQLYHSPIIGKESRKKVDLRAENVPKVSYYNKDNIVHSKCVVLRITEIKPQT